MAYLVEAIVMTLSVLEGHSYCKPCQVRYISSCGPSLSAELLVKVRTDLGTLDHMWSTIDWLNAGLFL